MESGISTQLHLSFSSRTKVLLIIMLFQWIIWTSMSAQWLLQVNCRNRQDINTITLTSIGQFGVLRKARPGIPQHFHTGIDIKRPSVNYWYEPVFPAHNGTVISVRDDGPFGQIIIEHEDDHYGKLWTVYEHIGGIRCYVNQKVSSTDTIARYFTKVELNKFGWQFDHLHFEIIKEQPPLVRARKELPYLRYSTFALTCYTEETLRKRQINPLLFYKK